MKPLWQPHPGPQTEFLKRNEYEVLFGGAAGPGKTDCLILAASRYVQKQKYSGLILRRTFPQLQEIMDRCREYYSQMGGEWKATESRWHWPSTGATVKLGHMQHEDDKFSYQGHEYGFIGFDELTQFTGTQYLYLHSRCRSVDPTLDPMVRATTNPGGVGHAFCKDRFVTITEPGTRYVDPLTGFDRCFIPARITDNPTLMINDPLYVKRLMLLPDEDRRRLLDGEWDVFEGQAFPELSIEVHGVHPFEIPPEWEVFRAFDWGYSSPFSVAWYACDFDGRLWRFKSLYGCKEEEPAKGLKSTAVEIARMVKEIERDIRQTVRPGPADPSIWSKNPTKTKGGTGPSVAEEMANEGIHWLKGDNNRLLGKHQVHYRFRREETVDPDSGEVKYGEPGVYIFKDDKHFWRTMGQLALKERNPEDIEDKWAEDHIYDEFRYALMSRPIRPKVAVIEDKGSFQHERRRLLKAQSIASRRGMPLSEAYRITRG